MAPRVREVREYQRIRTGGARGGARKKREGLGKARAYYRMHICRHVHFRASDPRGRRLFASRHLLAKPAGLFTYLLPCRSCVQSPLRRLSLSPPFSPFFAFLFLFPLFSAPFLPLPPASPGRRKVFAFHRGPASRPFEFRNSTGTGKQTLKSRLSALRILLALLFNASVFCRGGISRANFTCLASFRDKDVFFNGRPAFFEPRGRIETWIIYRCLDTRFDAAKDEQILDPSGVIINLYGVASNIQRIIAVFHSTNSLDTEITFLFDWLITGSRFLR